MSRPSVVVAGLGRCGTSLVMQMLDAAGVPTVGRAPAFEYPGAVARPGQAIKWLDPHRTPAPFRGRAVTLWLDRVRVEQARSQIKMVRLLEDPSISVDVGRLAAHLDRETAAALRVLPLPRMRLLFELLILHPPTAAAAIADHLGRWFGPLDVDAMVACVLPRTPECQPGLDIELALSDAAPVPG